MPRRKRKSQKSQGRLWTARENRKDPGTERARKHIEEARELSIELGGTDKKVKEFFFALTEDELHPILDDYERRFGSSARGYAEFALPRWRSGRTKMSGLVAERLFSLLPMFMPLATKYQIVRELWESKAPTSRLTFYVGADAVIEDVVVRIRQRLSEVVSDHEIAPHIVERFRWLAGDDVELQQQLCNYYKQLDREVVTRALEQRLTNFVQSVDASHLARIEAQINQRIIVGKHHVTVCFHPAASGIGTTAPRQMSPEPGAHTGCLVMALAGVLLVMALRYV